MNQKLFHTMVVLAISWQVIKALNGENVCDVPKSSTIFRLKSVPYQVIDKSGRSCTRWQRLWLFHKCWKVTVELTKSITETHVQWTTTKKCCAGYMQISNDTSKLICSKHTGDGLAPDPGSVPCLSRCSENCRSVDGYCDENENCICRDGYEKSTSNPVTSVSVCSEDCLNGTCSGPVNCTCVEGYVKNTVAPFNCVPLCPDVCDNDCSGSSNCTCPEGTWKDTVAPFNCIPYCYDGCNNNSCVEGYFRVDLDVSTCQYTCSCDSFNCSDPYKCMCFNGCDDTKMTMPLTEETLPWGFIGAAFVILILIVCASLLAYYVVKRNQDLVVIEETVEPIRGRKTVIEHNSMYSTVDMLPVTQRVQNNQSCKSQAECIYANASFNPDTNVTNDSVQEENALYGAFELSAMSADGKSV